MEMEREELLKTLRRQEAMDNLRCLGCGHEHHCSTEGCAINRAAAELIEQLEAENEALRHPPNPPLTPEQLREMDGPGWICYLQEIWGPQPATAVDISCTRYKFTLDTYGKTWLAYRRKPGEASP